MSGRSHRPRDPAGDLETPAAGSWRRGAAIARSLRNDHDEWRGRGQLRDTRLRRYADPLFVIAPTRMGEASEVIDDLRNCPPRIDASIVGLVIAAATLALEPGRYPCKEGS